MKEAGLVAACDGNISFRRDDGTVVITPSGVPKGELKPKHLLVVDLDGQKADVSADKAISAEDFKKVITTAGYTLQNLTTPKKEEDETMEKTLKIEGMMCQHCQKHVHDALAAMDGVTAVTVDLEGKKADVTASKDIPTEAFAKVIADAGYELVK